MTGQSFRRLVEALLRVPYRAVRESDPRKSGKVGYTEEKRKDQAQAPPSESDPKP